LDVVVSDRIALFEDDAPRPLAALLASLGVDGPAPTSRPATRPRRVTLVGSSWHLALPTLAETLRRHARPFAVDTDAIGWTPEHLDAVAPEVLHLTLWGTPITHDATVGSPGSWVSAMRLLRHAHRTRVDVRLMLQFQQLERWLDSVEPLLDHAAVVRLTPHPDEPPPARHLTVFLQRLIPRFTGSPTALCLDGLTVPPVTVSGPPSPPIAAWLQARRDGGWTGGTGAVALGPATHDATLLSPLRAVPRRPQRFPGLGGEVGLLIPAIDDPILPRSTLPALAAALRAAGARVHVESVWAPPWNLYAPTAPGHGPGSPPPDTDRLELFGGDAALTRSGRRADAAQRFADAFLDHVPWAAAPAWIVPHPAIAARVAPRLPAHVRMHVLDLHMLQGVRDLLPFWRAHPDRVVLHSAFPGYVGRYLDAGVPLDRVVWSPYPLALSDLPDGPPASAQRAWVTAGNQARAVARLVEALHGRAVPPPIVHTRHALPPGTERWDNRGEVPLTALVRTLQGARGVIVPVQPSADGAAGVSVAALAIALGRPVVGTDAWGLADHVRHGVDGVLVPEDAPHLLGDVLERLTTDDAWLDQLADGARAHRSRLDVAARAAGWLDGCLPAWPV
jgi:hypothetical protein